MKDDKEFSQKLERYLSETLHNPIIVNPLKEQIGIPVFLEHLYNLFEVRVAERRCLVLAARENPATPSEIGKHVSLVRSAATDAIVVFAAASLPPHNRSRLIGQGTSFIIPGNQLYIPELAMDLREHFRAPMPQHPGALSPAAQAVLFNYLLHSNAATMTPSGNAERLHYSTVSIGRAFDDLVALKLATAQRNGKERSLKFNADGRELLDSARAFLRSPVRAVKNIQSVRVYTHWKRAGESALAELTDLSRPQIDTYAIPATEWVSAKKAFNLIEVPSAEPDFAIETWAYDPAGLSDGPIVDPLSLYAQFWNHPDERVSMAAEKLLENLRW